MKKTLSIRAPEAGERAQPKSWGLTGERLERLKARAREERRHPTAAELKLWDHLRGGQIGGLRFNRKAIVGSVLADFACPSRWVVVNLSHAAANAEVDALQDRKLAETGIRVLRFAEADLLADPGRVVDAIKTEVNKPFDKRTAQREASLKLSGQFAAQEG